MVFAFKFLEWITQARTATQFSAFGQADNADVTIFTVPAGQTGFIADVQCGIQPEDASNRIVQINIEDTVPAVVHSIFVNGSIAGTSNWFWQFQKPFQLPTGYSIHAVSGTASRQINLAVSGWVE